MSSGPDPTAGYPSQGPYWPGSAASGEGQAYDPVTGQSLAPGPAAYSAVDPYAQYTYPQQPAPQTGQQPPFAQPYPGYPQAGSAQSGFPQPGFPQSAYPQSAYPQPGYQSYGAPAGYQLVPMYAGPPARAARPGGAVAAAVLAFVQSGFVLIGGVVLLSATSTAYDLGFNSRLGAELTIVAVLILLAGALLIAGGTALLGRKSTLMSVGTGLSLAISVYFVIKLADFANGGTIWLPIIYAILPIIALALSMGSDVRVWIKARNTEV